MQSLLCSGLIVVLLYTSPNCQPNKDFKFKYFVYFMIEFSEIRHTYSPIIL